MTREQWTALARRCEAATGPDPQIDALIWNAVYAPGSELPAGAELTASLDAIRALTERELPKHLLTLVAASGKKVCARLRGDGFDALGYAVTEELARTAALCSVMAERTAS